MAFLIIPLLKTGAKAAQRPLYDRGFMQGRRSDFLMGVLTGSALLLVGALNFFSTPKMTRNSTLNNLKFGILLHFRATLPPTIGNFHQTNLFFPKKVKKCFRRLRRRKYREKFGGAHILAGALSGLKSLVGVWAPPGASLISAPGFMFPLHFFPFFD